MNVLIAGAGKVGYFLAKELMIDNDVILIDNNEETIQNIQESLDILSICGDVKNPKSYQSISQDIDLFIAVTNSDEVNLLSCLIIDNIVNVKEKIVRLKNNFFKSNDIKKRLSIDEIITPSINVSKLFNFVIDFPFVNNVKIFDYTKAFLLSIRVDESFDPILIKTFVKDFNHKLIISGIERSGKFFIPKEMDVVMPNDLLYLFTFANQMKYLQKNVCINSIKSLKNCVVYGANQQGIEIAKVLSKKSLNVKLLDKSIQRCKEANAVLKNSVEVIKSNYNMDDVLEEDAKNTDMFVCSTSDDEYNITKCMEAKQKGIVKVIGTHNNKRYASLMRNLGVEVIRGEKINAIYSILERISSSRLISQRSFCGGVGSVLLIKLFNDSKLIGKKLKLSSSILEKSNFFIVRDERVYEQNKIETLKEEDIIVSFCLTTDIKEVEGYLL